MDKTYKIRTERRYAVEVGVAGVERWYPATCDEGLILDTYFRLPFAGAELVTGSGCYLLFEVD